MSNKLDQEQVRKVAKLARLELTDAEVEQFSGELSAIIGYIEKMNELNTDDVEPLAHCLSVSNVFRKMCPNNRWMLRRRWAMLRKERMIISKCRKC